jgi:hypothetical protein
VFSEKYTALERKFRDRVAQDKECFGLESLFLPNIAPQDPVDFVLIGMEPSIGGEGASILDVARKKIKRGFKNFASSTEDFILHFCIKEYLCAGWGTYYLTDLSKGAMSVRAAKSEREKRYEKWHPLLLDELELVAGQKATPIIAIGNEVEGFLTEKERPKLAGKNLHYSAQAAGSRRKIPDAHPKCYAEFSPTVGWKDIGQTVNNEGRRNVSIR